MVETENSVENSSGSPDPYPPKPRSSEESRAILDFVLAGCICLAAVLYWMWDSRPATPGVTPSVPVVAAEAKPIPRDPFNDEGYRLYAAADYVGAEAQFRKAIHANPKAAVGFCNLGAALIAQRRYDEAISTLQMASALDPSLALARNNLSWAIEEKAKHGR